MPAIAPIAINDGKSTPELHTFNPVSVTPAVYRENAGAGVPSVGELEITSTLRRAGANSDVNRVKVSLHVPVLETASAGSGTGYEAPPKIAYHLQANLEFLLPSRSTSDQRNDLIALIRNLLANAQVESMVETLDIPY